MSVCFMVIFLLVTNRKGSEVWIWEHVRMRESPRCVSSSVVYQNAWVCAVGHVHKYVITVTEESVLQMSHFDLIIDHQICQKSVGPQYFSRQCHASHLKITIHISIIYTQYYNTILYLSYNSIQLSVQYIHF